MGNPMMPRYLEGQVVTPIRLESHIAKTGGDAIQQLLHVQCESTPPLRFSLIVSQTVENF